MASAIAGLTAAVLNGTAMQIVSAAAVTFVSVLGMAMTAYQFVSHAPPPPCPSSHAPPPCSSHHTPAPDAAANRRQSRRARRRDLPPDEWDQ